LSEAGDFILARGEGAVTDAHLQGEIGEVLEGQIPGRRSDEEITLFKSLGIAVEDLGTGWHVYRKALAAGGGSTLSLGASGKPIAAVVRSAGGPRRAPAATGRGRGRSARGRRRRGRSRAR